MGLFNNTFEIEFFAPGVPSFSILGNTLFNYYTSEVQSIIFLKAITPSIFVKVVLLATIREYLQNLVEYSLGEDMVLFPLVSVQF